MICPEQGERTVFSIHDTSSGDARFLCKLQQTLDEMLAKTELSSRPRYAEGRSKTNRVL